MNFSHECTIAANREDVWNFLLDMENVGRCLPGVESMERLDKETYQGVLRIKAGPIRLKFQGTLRVEVMDREKWQAGFLALAKDRRLGGGVRAHLNVALAEAGPGQTEMSINLMSHVLGKIGEFGQPVMWKKTEAILKEFAQTMSQELVSAKS